MGFGYDGGMPAITVVTGPPCGGKSTYVDEQAKDGDIVIDMDRIALALSPIGTKSFEYSQSVRTVARAARKAAVRSALGVAQGQRYLGIWIIHTDPSNDDRSVYRYAGARFVEMSPGKDVCFERLKNRPLVNQQLARELIENYYYKR
jgi:hypothetical protein